MINRDSCLKVVKVGPLLHNLIYMQYIETNASSTPFHQYKTRKILHNRT